MKIIKRYLIKKVVVTSMSLFLLLLFIIIPTKNNIKKIEKPVQKNKSIYLLDKDNYVSKVNCYYDAKNIKDEISEKINILKSGTSNFKGIIPNNIKLNNIEVDKDKVYLDFNEDFNNIKDKTKIYEAIVYSLTDINGINKIYISVNKKMLDNMPLERNIGINKKYNLDSFDYIDKVTIFFSKDDYIVPITFVSNNKEEKINIIIKELKSSINALNNLNGYINDEIKLVDYSVDKDKIELVFNKFIFDDEKIKNLIASSIFENYNVNQIVAYNSDKSVSVTIKK